MSEAVTPAEIRRLRAIEKAARALDEAERYVLEGYRMSAEEAWARPRLDPPLETRWKTLRAALARAEGR